MSTPQTHWFWKWLQPQRRRKLARQRRAQVESLEQRSLLATLLQSYFPDAIGPQDLAAVGYRVAATDNYYAVGSQAAVAGFSKAGEAYVFNTTGGFVSRLQNPTLATDDAFGSAIAASGNLVVVGAYQHDQIWQNTGAAYVFRADTGALLFTLQNPTDATGDEFGFAVAIDGNLIAVGARSDEWSAPNSGIVHLFAADTGLLIRTIENPDPGNDDAFGSALALKGTTLVVGAPSDDTGAADSGRAYLFNTTSGTLIDTIDNPAPAAGDQFGAAVAIAGTTAVIGAALDDTVAADAGSVYLFDTAMGDFLRSLNHPGAVAGDQFGVSVGIFGNRVVAGAQNVDDVDYGGNVGRAFVFSASTGDLLQMIQNPTPDASDQFGMAVAISSAGILIGNPGSDIPGSGDTYNGIVGTDGGAGVVFDSVSYGLTATLIAPTPAASDGFGSAMTISGDWYVVGNPGDDTSAQNSGKVQVYSVSTGALLHTFLAPPNNPKAAFGTSVAVSGNVLAVGAPGLIVDIVTVGGVLLFDLSTGAFLRTIENASPVPAPSAFGGDLFGRSVALDGNTLVVGSPLDDTHYGDGGAVYLFDATTGALLRTLTKPGLTNERFGFAVAMSAGRIAVGAPLNDTGSADGGQVFVFDAATGALLHSLGAVTPVINAQFGFALDLEGNNLVVGSPYANAGTSNSGLITFIYADTGVRRGSLSTGATSSDRQFGYSIDISGNKVVVGSPNELATGLRIGAARVIDLLSWNVVDTLINPSPAAGDRFGEAVAISGNIMAVSATGDATVNVGMGAVYTYQQKGLSATLTAGELTISDATAGVSNTLTVIRDGSDLVITDANEEFIAAPAGGVLENNRRTLRFPAGLTPNALNLNLGGGADALTLDLTGGALHSLVRVDLGIAGVTSNSDSLTISGGNQGAVNYDYMANSITLANFGVVTFAGTEQLLNTGTATSVNFKFPSLTSAAAMLTDDGNVTNNLLAITSGNFPTTIFSSSTDLLSVDPNNSLDALTVGMLPQFGGSLTIGGAADLINTLTFTGSTTFAADRNLTAFAKGLIRLQNSANLNLSGSGSAAFTTQGQIELQTGAGLTTVDGNLLLSANETTSSTFFGPGVLLSSAVVQATGNGNVTVRAKGGNPFTGSANYGVAVAGPSGKIAAAAGTVNVTGFGGGSSSANTGNIGVYLNGGSIVGGSGAVTVAGTGGGASSFTASSNDGVTVGSQAKITSLGGAVSVTGNGGVGQNGVVVVTDGEISAGGSGAVTVIGTAGNAFTHGKVGVLLNGTNARITSAGGNVRVEGKGGGGNDFGGNHGVALLSSGYITAGGLGTVTVIGVGDYQNGNNNSANYGVYFSGNTSTRIGSAGGAVSVTGTGGGAIANSASTGVHMVGGEISAGGTASVTVDAFGAALGNGNHGLLMSNLARITSSGGPVLVRGTAGSASASQSAKGVWLQANATITSGGTGAVTVEGRGATNAAATSSANVGVLNQGGMITSAGDVIVRGWGGGSGSSSGMNDGVGLASSGIIRATVAGTVTIEGTAGNKTGGSSGGRNVGVTIVDTFSVVTSVTGAITITGVGGGAGTAATGNSGIYLVSSQGVSSQQGAVRLTGSSGAGNSGAMGVEMSASTVYSQTNLVQLTGSVATKTSTNFGIALGTSSVSSNTTVAGIELIADAMNLSGNNISVTNNRPVTIRPLTPGWRITLGAADSSTTLGLTNAELSTVGTAGTLQIGDSNSGEILLAGSISRGTNTHVVLTAGPNRNIALSTFSFTVPNTANLTLNVTGTGTITGATSGSYLQANTVSLLAESGNIGTISAPIDITGTYFNAQTLGSFYVASMMGLRNGSIGLSAGGMGYLAGGAYRFAGTNVVGDTTSLYLGSSTYLYLEANYVDTFASLAGDPGRLMSDMGDFSGTVPRITLTANTGTYVLQMGLGDSASSGANYIEFIKQGGSTWHLNVSSSLQTMLRVEGGLVIAEIGASLGGAGGYTQVLPGSALRLNNSTPIAAEPLRLSGSGYLTDPALGVNVTIYTVSFNGPITLEGDATIGGPQGTLILNGVIDDGASTFGLQKTGGSSVHLNGASSYNGPTLVSDGILWVNSSSFGPAIVDGPGTLNGAGTIHNQVTVNSGGTLGSIGLTINRPGQPALLLNAGAKMARNVGDTAYSLTVNGSVTLGSAGNYPTLDLSKSGNLPAGKYILVQNDGTDPIDGFFVSGVGSSLPAGTVLAEGAAISGDLLTSGMAATISYVGGTGNDVEITLNPRPTIAALGNQTINEDASPVTVNLSGITAGATDSQELQVTASSSNLTLFSLLDVAYTSPATTGILTFQPAANAFGTAIISVSVRDAGLDGVLNTLDDSRNEAKFTVTVNPINDAPSFVQGAEVVATTFFPQTRANWLTAISAGPNESQTVSFNVTSNTNAGLFAVQPTIAANGTLTFTPVFGQFGSSTITLEAKDNGGVANGGVDTSAPQTFTITVAQPAPLQVQWFAPTTTGGVFHFSRDIDPSALNLYDVAGNLLGPADLVVSGSTGGVVRGSAVVDPGLRKITFVSTAGKLPADNYTMTLRSAANGVRDPLGELLDGDANGTAGGDFTYNFSVTAPAANVVTVSIPNFARGPEQIVNLPASSANGIPLSFSNGAGITAATFEIRYNAALLNITSASVAAGLPVGATVNLNTSTPGVALLTFSSPTPLVAGTTHFASLQANVPSTALYRNKQVLDIANISLNGGAIPSLDDDGVQVVAYFADVTGNGTYSAQDASYIARLAVGIDTGLEEFALLDPSIIGDVTGNGSFSATDTSLMLQAAVGIAVAEIPSPLPTVSLTQGGPDPKLSIPQNLVATAGGALTIPVDIDSIVNLTGNGLASADLVIYYDPTVLEITSATLGRLVSQRSGWLISSHIDPLAGRIDISLAGTRPLEGQFVGELVQLHATVKSTAPAGESAINLAATSRRRSTQLNEGFLTLIPAPTDAANDAIDGRVTITAANNGASNEPAVRLVNERLLITGTTGDDRILVSHVDAEHVRVRIGNRVLGTFAAPQGVAIDALTGNDFIYVAPTAPAAIIAADVNNDDLIFAGDNSLLVESANSAAPDEHPAAVNQLTPHDLALLQMLANWHEGQQDSTTPLSPRTGVRRR